LVVKASLAHLKFKVAVEGLGIFGETLELDLFNLDDPTIVLVGLGEDELGLNNFEVELEVDSAFEKEVNPGLGLVLDLFNSLPGIGLQGFLDTFNVFHVPNEKNNYRGVNKCDWVDLSNEDKCATSFFDWNIEEFPLDIWVEADSIVWGKQADAYRPEKEMRGKIAAMLLIEREMDIIEEESKAIAHFRRNCDTPSLELEIDLIFAGVLRP
jgi:hypothetical protein